MTSESVINALVEQIGCYRRLAKLAELQHEYVQHNRTEQLLEVLRSRQECLDRAAEFENQLEVENQVAVGECPVLTHQGAPLE